MASRAIRVTQADVHAALELARPYRSAPGKCRAITVHADLSMTFTEWEGDGTKREVRYLDPLEGAAAAQEGKLRFRVVPPARVPASCKPRKR